MIEESVQENTRAQEHNYSSIEDVVAPLNPKMNHTTNNINFSSQIQSHPTQQNSHKLARALPPSLSKNNNNYLNLQPSCLYSLSATLPAHRNTVKALTYDHTLGHLWSASKDYSVRQWALTHSHWHPTGQQPMSHRRGVNCLYAEESLGLVFSGGEDCLIKVFDAR